MPITLIVGGARSGKSRYAQQLALELWNTPIYVATSREWDDDHRARIERHRRERSTAWSTVEEQRNLADLPWDDPQVVVVVDCITLWLTNLFCDGGNHVESALSEARQQIDTIATRSAHWLLVSNELGMGVHAATDLGRKFADLQGWVNQHAAAQAQAVALMVAGIPLYVKGAAPVRHRYGL
ncbi:bifunctional adenosylcobinamide kinase/adenosylcobinamide-phosphate guanylyltransferase [Myxococcota bacterium]